jgi:hypothetical protein
MFEGLPSLAPPAFFAATAALVRSENQTSFFLGQRRVKVQHEGIGIPAQFRHYKGHSLRHQPGNKRYVA